MFWDYVSDVIYNCIEFIFYMMQNVQFVTTLLIMTELTKGLIGAVYDFDLLIVFLYVNDLFIYLLNCLHYRLYTFIISNVCM